MREVKGDIITVKISTVDKERGNKITVVPSGKSGLNYAVY